MWLGRWYLCFRHSWWGFFHVGLWMSMRVSLLTDVFFFHSLTGRSTSGEVWGSYGYPPQSLLKAVTRGGPGVVLCISKRVLCVSSNAHWRSGIMCFLCHWCCTCVLLVHWLSLLFIYLCSSGGSLLSSMVWWYMFPNGKRPLSAQKLLDTLIFTSYQVTTLWYLSCYGIMSVVFHPLMIHLRCYYMLFFYFAIFRGWVH